MPVDVRNERKTIAAAAAARPQLNHLQGPQVSGVEEEEEVEEDEEQKPRSQEEEPETEWPSKSREKTKDL